MTLQRVQPIRPELPVEGNPVIDLPKPCGTKGIDALLPTWSHFRKTGLAENSKMAGDRWLREKRELLHQLSRSSFATLQKFKNPPPGRVRDGR